MKSQEITLARAAYARYGAVTDFKNFQGNPMPAWEALPAKIQEAWVNAANPPVTVESVNTQVAQLFNGEAGYVRDGYHSFDELYDHRIGLHIKLCECIDLLNAYVSVHEVWRSKAHSDGGVWEGWFLLGINKEPGKQITYHLPISRWDECEFAETLDKAPEFDGHTSADVLERLKQL